MQAIILGQLNYFGLHDVKLIVVERANIFMTVFNGSSHGIK